jgi:hypothetical protein
MTGAAKESLLSRSHLRDVLIVVVLLTARHSHYAFYLGILLFIEGLVLRLWAKAVLMRNESLTVDGPYALCRHPFYLGNLLLDLGLCLMSGHLWLAVVYPPIFVWVYWTAMRREEGFLREKFPKEFERFSPSSRLFPLPPREWPQLRAQWSWKRILDQRELSRALRLLAVPALVLCACEAWEGGLSELLEYEGLSLIAAAAMLHMSANLAYRVLERPKRTWKVGPKAVTLGLSCVAVGFLGMTIAALAGGPGLNALALQVNAVPIMSVSQLRHEMSVGTAGPFLASDDILEDLPAAESREVEKIGTYWSRLEVYYLLRPLRGTAAPKLP